MKKTFSCIMIALILIPLSPHAGNKEIADNLNAKGFGTFQNSNPHIVPNFTINPKESSFSEATLNSRAKAMLRDASKNSASGLVRESSKKRASFNNISREAWLNYSYDVTQEPYVHIGDKCVEHSSKHIEQQSWEEYEVEIDDLVQYETQEPCEEDNINIHRCEKTLQIHCNTPSESTVRFDELGYVKDINVQWVGYREAIPSAPPPPISFSILKDGSLRIEWSGQNVSFGTVGTFTINLKDIKSLSSIKLKKSAVTTNLFLHINNSQHIDLSSLNSAVELKNLIRHGDNYFSLSRGRGITGQIDLSFYRRTCEWYETWVDSCEDLGGVQ